MKPFKGALCACSVPGDGGWMNLEARRSCIRRLGHPGPHRNRRWKWFDGDVELSPRTDKDRP